MSIPACSTPHRIPKGETTGPFTGQMNPDELSPWMGPAGWAGSDDWAA